jgi:hypothetical protein
MVKKVLISLLLVAGALTGFYSCKREPKLTVEQSLEKQEIENTLPKMGQ